MAPVRSSTRRGAHPTPTPPIQDTDGDDPNTNKELFLDPMLGTPLAIYLEKEVEDKDNIAQLIIVSYSFAIMWHENCESIAGSTGVEFISSKQQAVVRWTHFHRPCKCLPPLNGQCGTHTACFTMDATFLSALSLEDWILGISGEFFRWASKPPRNICGSLAFHIFLSFVDVFQSVVVVRSSSL